MFRMNRMEIMREAELKNFNWKFCKVHRMTYPNQKQSGNKSTIHMSTVVPKIFVCFALRLAVFEIFHILGFLTDSMLKFQSATFF